MGGNTVGRAALAAAIDELKAGTGESGRKNAGPLVWTYLEPAGLEEGNIWCAHFTSWGFLHACSNEADKMPFPCPREVRAVMNNFKKSEWVFEP